jgi:hypothetical protein
VTVCTRDGGECFFHSELKRLLDQQLGHGMFSVEYRSEHWSHPDYPAYWKVWAHVGRPNPTLRALRIMSIHEAVAERSTQMAGINDAARQAFYAYRDHFFEEISQDERRYYPRRRRGELAMTIASTTDEQDPRVHRTVKLVAVTNTELNSSLVELKQVRKELDDARKRIAQLEAQITGVPPPSPKWPAFSPPREDPAYGDASARTTIE